MFTNTLSPTILEIGFLQIRWYSIFYLFGFLSTWWVLNKASDSGNLNVTRKEVEQFITYALIGVIIGARLFEVFVWEPAYFLQHPERILQVWRGGLSFHGGLIGLLIAGWYWSRKHKVPFAKLCDLVTLPAVFSIGLGRIGNFFNHEIYGQVTNVPWCVQFNGVEGCRHPAQLYGAAGRFMLFGLLYWIKQYRSYKEGFLTWCFVFFTGVGRFFADHFREDSLHYGLSTGQWLSVIMAIMSLYVLYVYYWPDVRRIILRESL